MAPVEEPWASPFAFEIDVLYAPVLVRGDVLRPLMELVTLVDGKSVGDVGIEIWGS